MKTINNLDVKLQLTYGKVLVEPIYNNVLKSGLVLPEHVESAQPSSGIVADLGWKRFLHNGDIEEYHVKIGDKVFFKINTGASINFKGKEYYIINETDFIGVIKE